MPTSDLRFRRLRHGTYALALLTFLIACSDSTSPPAPPSALQIVSGDAQYTRKGTKLEEPVVVRVTNDKGAAAANATVHFQVIEGGGHLSRSAATTNNDGRTSVAWTLGPNTGLNRLRITVAENSALGATATATSSEYYCVEEDPTFSASFSPAHNLMMLTRASSLGGGHAALVRYAINSGGAQVTFTGNLVSTYTDTGFRSPWVIVCSRPTATCFSRGTARTTKSSAWHPTARPHISRPSSPRRLMAPRAQSWR